VTQRGPAPSDSAARFFAGLAAVTRMIRARHELSQREVARRAGVGARLVSDVENERADPTVTRLHQLALGLGLSGVIELTTLADETATDQARLPRSTAEL
jgi:transcriptional regulator with XRE-family HTH domain